MRLPARLLLTLLFVLAATHAAHAQFGGGKADVSAALNYSALPPGQQAVIAVVIDIPKGLHAQSHTPTNENFIALQITVAPNPAVETYEPIYPEGEIKEYKSLGRLSVYEGKTIVYVPLQVKQSASPGPLKLEGTVTYQLCNDKMCFPPPRDPPAWSIETQVVSAGASLEPNQADLFKNFDHSAFAKLIPVTKKAPKVELFGRELTADSVVFPFIAAFLIGIIFNVMPCVLPVVPLKIMGFYEVSQHHRLRSLALALVFSLGIISVFAALGLFVVIPGKNWGQLFGNAWFLSLIVVLLLIFGLAQFGFFSVGLPSFVYQVTPRHDTFVGNFLFGAFTAILSTPCTFGLFLGLLIWAVAQPPAIGLSLLITVGAGMAFPYIVLSAFPEVARRFPRTGPWAELVKQMMGFLLIGSAVFFARRFLGGLFGQHAFWWMLFAVVAVAAIFLIARTIQFSRRLMPRLVAGAVALLIIAPALAFTIRQTNPPIDWKPYSSDALAAARSAGKIVMLEFTADWCGNCLALEATTFHDKRTVGAIKKHEVVALRADLSDQSAPGWDALNQISAVGAIPLTALYSPHLPEPIQLTGLYSPAELVDALEAASSGAKAAETSSVSDIR
jgi:suppressor for copper-sensitivity B